MFVLMKCAQHLSSLYLSLSSTPYQFNRISLIARPQNRQFESIANAVPLSVMSTKISKFAFILTNSCVQIVGFPFADVHASSGASQCPILKPCDTSMQLCNFHCHSIINIPYWNRDLFETIPPFHHCSIPACTW